MACPAATALALILALAAAGPAAAADDAGTDPEWRLEIDGKITCTGTQGDYNHTDTIKGLVSFRMPETSGEVTATGGSFSYRSVGQTMGNPWEISVTGTLSFTGEVTPGRLTFRPRARLTDGTEFYDPVPTLELPVEDGAVLTETPSSADWVTCDGYVHYTLRGVPLEKYRITVDDRLYWGRDLGVYGGLNFTPGVTVQVLTEIGVTVEDDEVTEVSGSRRLGRVTPTGRPPGLWSIRTLRECPDGGAYPFAPPLSDSQVSASVRDDNTIALSVAGGKAGAAIRWSIDRDKARQISPGEGPADPARFDDYWCADLRLPVTRWSFTRRRNSVTRTEDTFTHLQIFSVTQQATASSPAPAPAGPRPRPDHFGGDARP